MGKTNVRFNECMGRKSYFADCINTVVGKKILSPDDLCDADKILSGEITGGKGTYEKRNDTKKIYCSGDGIPYAVLTIENQKTVNDSMVVRSYVYDAYTYDRQLNVIRKRHKTDKDLRKDAFVAGFSKEDVIIPSITVCVYVGDIPWDAPCELHRLMKFDRMPEKSRRVLENLCTNSQLLVLDVKHTDEKVFEDMDTDLKYLFGMLRCTGNKEEMHRYVQKHAKELESLDEDIYNAIASMTDIKDLDKVMENAKNKEGGINMCKAYEDLKKDWKAEGEERVSRLNLILIAAKKFEELEQAARDKGFRNKLFQQYGI